MVQQGAMITLVQLISLGANNLHYPTRRRLRCQRTEVNIRHASLKVKLSYFFFMGIKFGGKQISPLKSALLLLFLLLDLSTWL